MSWWARLTSVLKREAADARDMAEEMQDDLNASLDRREREMNASPEERLDSALSDAAKADAEFEEAARRIRERDAHTTDPDVPG